MDTPKLPSKLPSPAHSHHGSRKSLRSIRSSKSLKSTKSTRSNRSTQSIRVFNHAHLTYHTCFGCIHVKVATCAIGVVVLVAVCLSLVYCVFASQEQHRPSMKLYALPMIVVIVSLLYMFVGVLQQKANLLYPFISLQILFVFLIAITIVMITIAVVCNTKYILRVFVNVDETPKEEYQRLSLVTASVLMSQLFVHLWALRAVCGCCRYFTDISKFNIRHAQLNYV